MNQVGYTGLVEGPRRWDILSGFMLTQGYKTFVEVGCKEGRTTGHILKVVPDSRVVAIDPWMKQEESADKTKETYQAWDFEKIEREFWENVGKPGNDAAGRPRCVMMQMTSETAAKKWEIDTPLGWQYSEDTAFGETKAELSDLIFIDALHDYEHVRQDISLWWPRVRVGGILAGHDFNHKWPGVERAVAESFNLMHVGVAPDSVWFVLKQSEDQFCD